MIMKTYPILAIIVALATITSSAQITNLFNDFEIEFNFVADYLAKNLTDNHYDHNQLDGIACAIINETFVERRMVEVAPIENLTEYTTQQRKTMIHKYREMVRALEQIIFNVCDMHGNAQQWQEIKQTIERIESETTSQEEAFAKAHEYLRGENKTFLCEKIKGIEKAVDEAREKLQKYGWYKYCLDFYGVETNPRNAKSNRLELNNLVGMDVQSKRPRQNEEYDPYCKNVL